MVKGKNKPRRNKKKPKMLWCTIPAGKYEKGQVIEIKIRPLK